LLSLTFRKLTLAAGASANAPEDDRGRPAHRLLPQARAFTWIIGCSGHEPVDTVAQRVRGVWEDTAPFASGGVCVNALNAERPVGDACAGEVWDRLVAVKRRYDPDGVFDGNGMR
jgi:hypothetical protein